MYCCGLSSTRAGDCSCVHGCACNSLQAQRAAGEIDEIASTAGFAITAVAAASDVPPKTARSGGAFLRRTHYSYSVSRAGKLGTTRGWVCRAMQKAPSRITGPFGRSSVGGKCCLTPPLSQFVTLSFGSRRKWGGWISPITRAFSQVGEACHEMAVIRDRIWSWSASHRPHRGADREEVDEHGGLCSTENPAQRPKGEARARQIGRSRGERARGRDGTATCGAVNEALSYRVTETPLS
jgi:hypothetical protein